MTLVGNPKHTSEVLDDDPLAVLKDWFSARETDPGIAFSEGTQAIVRSLQKGALHEEDAFYMLRALFTAYLNHTLGDQVEEYLKNALTHTGGHEEEVKGHGRARFRRGEAGRIARWF